MPSFSDHMRGHAISMRETFAAGKGAELREHHATELCAALINCGVSQQDADVSLKLMLVAYDAENVDLVMQEFSETVSASKAAA